jgi:hypothetical protein
MTLGPAQEEAYKKRDSANTANSVELTGEK